MQTCQPISNDTGCKQLVVTIRDLHGRAVGYRLTNTYAVLKSPKMLDDRRVLCFIWRLIVLIGACYFTRGFADACQGNRYAWIYFVTGSFYFGAFLCQWILVCVCQIHPKPTVEFRKSYPPGWYYSEL